MKKTLLLLSAVAMLLCGCKEKVTPEKPAADAELDGEAVDLSMVTGPEKVFVLNEGGMGSNNASLDFLRFSDAKYIRNAYDKMNPSFMTGLGDVGNDIAVNGDEVWIVVNNTGNVEVISAKDEKTITSVVVPTPRNIAFDADYAYVTSWAGAYVNGSYAQDGSYTVTDYKDAQGRLYRINLKTKKLEGSVEVGRQPEGVAVHDGKIYVANSGGISSQLPPDYSYDNTVSIVDAASFKVEKAVPVQINLNDVFSDGAGRIYVTSFGNYYDIHSGVYVLDASDPAKVAKVADFVSVSSILDGTLYCIGTDSEFDWSAAHEYKAFSVKDGKVSPLALDLGGVTPYSLAALSADCFLVGDAGDYFNPGNVNLLSKGAKVWSVTAGICPGHFAVLY